MYKSFLSSPMRTYAYMHMHLCKYDKYHITWYKYARNLLDEIIYLHTHPHPPCCSFLALFTCLFIFSGSTRIFSGICAVSICPSPICNSHPPNCVAFSSKWDHGSGVGHACLFNACHFFESVPENTSSTTLAEFGTLPF